MTHYLPNYEIPSRRPCTKTPKIKTGKRPRTGLAGLVPKGLAFPAGVAPGVAPGEAPGVAVGVVPAGPTKLAVRALVEKAFGVGVCMAAHR